MPLSLPAVSLQIWAVFSCSVTNLAAGVGSVPSASRRTPHRQHSRKLTDGEIRESCRVQRDLLCQLLYY